MNDLTVAILLLSGFCAVLALGGALGALLDWIDARRTPAPLSRTQLADRGVPLSPLRDATWDDVYPADAEGEVVP